VHDVNTKTIFELSQNLSDLSARARSGTLQREDFMGGTFTITSLGKLGGMFATPIVNYPEVSIIGIHNIEDRPVVVDGEIVIRKRMYLSASFDHRVIDGHIGAAFIHRIKGLLEDPDALLLELR
jgi:pyruvate dehydrogenase E2 component (dihydrolipoamide acetyltransferase)